MCSTTVLIYPCTAQMLGCIAGMVEKTQSAVYILQQRQLAGAVAAGRSRDREDGQAGDGGAGGEVEQAAEEEMKMANKEQNDCKEEVTL